MKVTETMTIIKRVKDDAYYGEKDGRAYVIKKGDSDYEDYEKFYEELRKTPFEHRPELVNTVIDENTYPTIFNGNIKLDKTTTEQIKAPEKTPREILIESMNRLINFFSEFSFTPSFRFTNTFAYACQEGVDKARTYVRNYFSLMDSSYQREVAEKIKSSEFRLIAENIQKFGQPKAPINSRLKIYFGNAGTGKTTKAQQECDNRCIVCNSSMLPADLIEDFNFEDGKPNFNGSLLRQCMEEGKKLVFDEINLLPYDSLRFLQGLTDGKSVIYYKKEEIKIKDGFQIIGTMNLTLGGMTYGLPEPLVDRCFEMDEFTLTAEQLALSILGNESEE